MNEEKTTRATGAETPMAQVCDAFDVAEVDGLAVREAAETRAVPGAFLDGFGWCTVTLDGRRALAIGVDHADSPAAQAALTNTQGKTHNVSVADATGFAGRTGPAEHHGGKAVLGDDRRVVRVTVEQSLIDDDAQADRVAEDLALTVLRSVSAQDR